jgi:hypothetical protein
MPGKGRSCSVSSRIVGNGGRLLLPCYLIDPSLCGTICTSIGSSVYPVCCSICRSKTLPWNGFSGAHDAVTVFSISHIRTSEDLSRFRKSRPMTRTFEIVRAMHANTRAGCHDCEDGHVRWTGKNAQAMAARHTIATGHTTWVELELTFAYRDPKSTQQTSEKHSLLEVSSANPDKGAIYGLRRAVNS